MTDEQITAEISWYFWRCRDEHLDTCITIDSIESYSPEQRRQAKAEIAYYRDKNRLPRWGYMIERVDTVEGNLIFVHADLRRNN